MCAFSRSFAGDSIVVVVPRLVFELTRGAEELPLGESIWLDTVISLTEGLGPTMRNVLTGETLICRPGMTTLPLSRTLSHFPVALLATPVTA